MDAVIPEGFHFGYRRKELALAPVSRTDEIVNGKTVKYVGAPSLIATIDSNYSAGAPKDLKFQWIQYFATGKAATALSLQPDVRIAMLRRLDPKQLPKLLPGELNASRISLVWTAYDYVRDLASEDNAKAKTLKAGLDKMGELVPPNYQFAERHFATGTLDLTIRNAQDAPIDFKDAGYARFHEYLSRLHSNLEKVDVALADTFTGTIDGKTKLDKTPQLKAERQTMVLLKQQLDSAIRNNVAIQESVYFYLTNPD